MVDKFNHHNSLKAGIMLFPDIDGSLIYPGDCLDRINNYRNGFFDNSKLSDEIGELTYRKQWTGFRRSGINIIEDPLSAVSGGYVGSIEEAERIANDIKRLSYE